MSLPTTLRAFATTSLSGPLAVQGRDAAAGLRAWSAASGIALTLMDDAGDAEQIARAYAEAAGGYEILLGPYGSGPTRAAVAALNGADVVLWNHGGAAIARPAPVRVVDVLAPAERYWAGLAPALQLLGLDPETVLIAHGPTPFGRAVAEGAVRSLADVGARPRHVRAFTLDDAASVADEARDVGATTVAGGATLEADLALADACRARGLTVALVGLGISEATDRLGAAVVGGIGPVQWMPGACGSPDGVRDYPGAQAHAAGRLAEAAITDAGTTEPECVWAAALRLRTTTALGAFAIDAEGRQIGHAPHLVRWAAGDDGPHRLPLWAPDGSGNP